MGTSTRFSLDGVDSRQSEHPCHHPHRFNELVLFSSVQSLGRLGRRGDMRNNSEEILFHIFFFFFLLQEAHMSGSGMGRDAHSLMFSNQHFIFRPQRHQPSKVPGRMVLGRLLWCVTSPNYASFCLLTVVRRGSCGPTRELILLHIQSLVLRSKEEILSGISLRRFSQACPVQHRLYK